MTKREREAKKLLQNLVKFLNKADGAAEQVWDILTALRGPDSNDEGLKNLTTGRLRSCIGLTNRQFHFLIANVQEEPLTSGQLAQVSGILKSGGHFHGHMERAHAAVKKLLGYDLKRERKVAK